MSARHDAIVIGAGQNGLVAAAYLAKAGQRVLVLERRDSVGGSNGTAEFHPGFRNSVASYTVSLLQPRVIADLDLHAHGLRIVGRVSQQIVLSTGRNFTEEDLFACATTKRHTNLVYQLIRII